ncbi:hypothetical protein NIES2119_08030 [[Phormidium ambiguum] IAM M-71]|uniref:Uncharacterized protein n=1 Tax=[Phormidium ambiguum] IAM M-71 TaxID=454136 RepID=A0A1U7INX5_9CYAN|nr:hypothetical protein [Phormidium ambiguum]OKH39068.1 hypothetical protein NIES2119_08030 [Phormidium ambiguum IAM M-71]
MAKKVYRTGEIKEEHELDLYFREFECPGCGGHGQVHYDLTWLTGEEGWEHCNECEGSGKLFLEDCRPCKYCGNKIYFEKINDKWKPFNAGDDSPHRCYKVTKTLSYKAYEFTLPSGDQPSLMIE